MAARAIIALLTDFGTSDPYVAAMKGVILSAAPDVQIVDLSHKVPAHDLLTGAFAVTYGHVEPGRPLVLFNSMELLELAVNQGSARDCLGAAVGTEIRVRHGAAAPEAT